MTSYRARCNKRPCQARRTIKGVYDPNDRERCHKPDCKGMMRIDTTRERIGWRDSTSQPLCHCDGVKWADTRNAPHNRGAVGCSHREDVLIERGMSPRSKHSPLTDGDELEF